MPRRKLNPAEVAEKRLKAISNMITNHSKRSRAGENVVRMYELVEGKLPGEWRTGRGVRKTWLHGPSVRWDMLAHVTHGFQGIQGKAAMLLARELSAAEKNIEFELKRVKMTNALSHFMRKAGQLINADMQELKHLRMLREPTAKQRAKIAELEETERNLDEIISETGKKASETTYALSVAQQNLGRERFELEELKKAQWKHFPKDAERREKTEEEAARKQREKMKAEK